MSSFRLLVDYDGVVFIESLPRPVRQSIRARLTEIRDHPTDRSDYAEKDAVGRRVDINICGGYAIKYWVDHADQHIKVLDVHPADQERKPTSNRL